ERVAVDFGGRGFLHPLWEIANAQIFDGRVCVEIEFAWHTGQITWVRSRYGAQYDNGVFDRARHGTELVKRPAKRHRTRARHAAVRGSKSCDTTAHCRGNDASSSFAADGKAYKAGSCGSTGAGTRTGSAFFE